MPRMLARKDPSVSRTLSLLVETSPDGLVYQALGLPLNFQQMLVRRCRMEVADPQRFVAELVSPGISVCLTLNRQGRNYWALVRQRRPDRGDTVLKLISGYVPARELNLPLLAAIQEVAEECPMETVSSWLGGRLGDIWLPTSYQGSLRCRENSHFVLTPSSGAAHSVQAGNPCLLECPCAYVHLPTASLQLVYDMCLELPRDAREPNLYHVDERLESGLLVTCLDRWRPDLYLLPLDQGHPTGGLFTLRKGQLRPAVTRGLWSAEGFAVQDGWLVHEERIRSRDRLALWPPSNGDQASGGRDHASA